MAEGKDIALLVVRVLFWLVYTMYCTLESLVWLLLPPSYGRKSVKGQVALVTGGGSGIGRLLCRRLAAEGAVVVTWDVNTQGNEETVQQVTAAGGKCVAYTVDLCNRHAVYAAANKVKQDVGKVDILVNNAGIITGKKLLDSPDESILKTFQVNTLSHFWTTKAFLGDMMIHNKGHIVTIASMAGKIPCNGMVDYCSSKYAAVGFDEALRLELKVLGKGGINTTVVCPVKIDTGMFDGATSRYFPDLRPEWVAEKTMDGILMNKEVLILPSYEIIIPALKIFLPEKSYYYLCEITELTKMMDRFTGRKKSN